MTKLNNIISNRIAQIDIIPKQKNYRYLLSKIFYFLLFCSLTIPHQSVIAFKCPSPIELSDIFVKQLGYVTQPFMGETSFEIYGRGDIRYYNETCYVESLDAIIPISAGKYKKSKKRKFGRFSSRVVYKINGNVIDESELLELVNQGKIISKYTLSLDDPIAGFCIYEMLIEITGNKGLSYGNKIILHRKMKDPVDYYRDYKNAKKILSQQKWANPLAPIILSYLIDESGANIERRAKRHSIYQAMTSSNEKINDINDFAQIEIDLENNHSWDNINTKVIEPLTINNLSDIISEYGQN